MEERKNKNKKLRRRENEELKVETLLIASFLGESKFRKSRRK